MTAHRGPLIVVSDEVGGGIVPMHPGARAFRDLAGIVHQRLAAIADEVVLTVAGLPVPLKGEEPMSDGAAIPSPAEAELALRPPSPASVRSMRPRWPRPRRTSTS